MTHIQGRLEALAPHWSRLVATAISKGAGSEAEDLAMEALIRVASSSSSEGLDGAVSIPYLLRALENLVVDHHRRTRRSDRLSRFAVLRPRQRAVDDDAANRDLAMRALMRIRETEEPWVVALIWSRAVDGLTWSELGAMFSITSSNAQSKVWRVMRKLRPWLARQVRSPEDLA